MDCCCAAMLGAWVMTGVIAAVVARVVRRYERRRAVQRQSEVRRMLRKRMQELQEMLAEPTMERDAHMARVNELMLLSRIEGYWGEKIAEKSG